MLSFRVKFILHRKIYRVLSSNKRNALLVIISHLDSYLPLCPQLHTLLLTSVVLVHARWIFRDSAAVFISLFRVLQILARWSLLASQCWTKNWLAISNKIKNWKWFFRDRIIDVLEDGLRNTNDAEENSSRLCIKDLIVNCTDPANI